MIDKPPGWTSHDVVAKVRRISGIKKVGHAGTLDPLATGLLIVLVGREATKRQAEFMKQTKKYLCTITFGQETDTYDREGQITSQCDWEKVSQVTQEQLKSTLEMFEGEIIQQVPAYSAIKSHGKKLYELAREGSISVEDLPSRPVTIFECTLRGFDKVDAAQTLSAEIEVFCSSGTYIRSLVSDIGKQLGVGAHVKELRRTMIGDFSVEQAQTIPIS